MKSVLLIFSKSNPMPLLGLNFIALKMDFPTFILHGDGVSSKRLCLTLI